MCMCVCTRPVSSSSSCNGRGKFCGRGEAELGVESKPWALTDPPLSRSWIPTGSWCIGDRGPLLRMSPISSVPLTGWANIWVVSWECTPPLSLSRPIISKDSSEWACLMLSITRLNPACSGLSINSIHVHLPRWYDLLRPPWPDLPPVSLTTLNLEEQPAPCPEASWEMFFLLREGVFGWEELPWMCLMEKGSDWMIRTTLGDDWLTGVVGWKESEVTLVIWKPLFFFPPLIFTQNLTVQAHWETKQNQLVSEADKIIAVLEFVLSLVCLLTAGKLQSKWLTNCPAGSTACVTRWGWHLHLMFVHKQHTASRDVLYVPVR